MARPLLLPRPDRTLLPYTPAARPALPQTAGPIKSRIAFAAVHIVADALADNDPWLDTNLDWDATLAYRRYVWGLGLGVAEAMDTAQRGMGFSWQAAKELIRRSVSEAKAMPGA